MQKSANNTSNPDRSFQQDGGPHPDAVAAQLERTLSSPEFEQSGRLQEFLKFVVEETIDGRAKGLKEFTIAQEVFDRDDTFDPQTSSIVRVEASRLRSKLDKYNAIDGRNDPIQIRLPSGHYVPVFEDNTIDSKPDAQSVDEVQPPLKPAFLSWKAAAFFLIPAIVIGIVVLQVFSPQVLRRETNRSADGELAVQPSSLAILPLRNLSNDIDQEYFSDGITDALITALAKRVTIRVISTRSVLAYKNVDKPVASIAEELGVSHVVEGAVMKVGDNIRITAQLIATENNTHLWAESFERNVSDVHELQNDVVKQIAQSLALRVAAGEPRIQNALPKRSQDAFEALLKGRFFQTKMTEDGLRKGLSYFKEAINKQPDYALAYSGMAACYCLLGGHGFEVVKPSEALPLARTAAIEAIKLNDSLAEPHAFLGIIRLKYEWDWKGAESEFLRSIALNPSYVQARLFYSYYLEAMGRKSEAIAQAREARAIDPISREANINLGWQLLQAGQLEEARLQFEATGEIDPDFWGLHWGLGHYHRRSGDPDAAIAAFLRAVEAGGGHVLPLNGLGYTYAISGNREKALEVIAELDQLSQDSYVSPVNMAAIYAGLRETDLVFFWLEKAFEDRSRSLVWLNVLPEFNTLRADKRFTSLLSRIGLPG